jgi:hypothetical protein
MKVIHGFLGLIGLSAALACQPAEGGPSEDGPFCGGIAGIPCPGSGTCFDDRSDECDPQHGGADCGGLCRCVKMEECDKGSRWDDSPDVCACVSDDPCAAVRCPEGTRCVAEPTGASCVGLGPKCGSTVCSAGNVCCNASCGICTPPGRACIQIACD